MLSLLTTLLVDLLSPCGRIPPPRGDGATALCYILVTDDRLKMFNGLAVEARNTLALHP